MNKIALNAMDRHGFMTDHKFAGGDSLNDLRSLYGRIKPSDTDYKSTIQSLIGFDKKDRLSVVNPTSKLIGVADFPRRMADHKPSLDEIRSKAAYKLGLSQNRYSGYGGHSIPSRIETNPALKDYMSRTKTASVDYEEMVKLAYEDIIEGFEKEAGFGDALKSMGSSIGSSVKNMGASISNSVQNAQKQHLSNRIARHELREDKRIVKDLLPKKSVMKSPNYDGASFDARFGPNFSLNIPAEQGYKQPNSVFAKGLNPSAPGSRGIEDTARWNRRQSLAAQTLRKHNYNAFDQFSQAKKDRYNSMMGL